MPHVYSTLSCDNFYPRYVEKVVDGSPNLINGGVLIKGGANVAHQRYIGSDGTNTPKGVRTEITDEDMLFLLNDENFLLHQKNGFVVIHEDKVKIAEAVTDMESADDSAPFTAADYEKGGRAHKDGPIQDITAPVTVDAEETESEE